jgi:hypothetical protein
MQMQTEGGLPFRDPLCRIVPKNAHKRFETSLYL